MSDLAARLRDLLGGGGGGGANVVLAAVVVLVVGLLVVAVVYAFYLSSNRGKMRAALEQRATSRRGSYIGVSVLALALFVLALFASTQYLERPSTCAQCHAGPAYAESLEQSPHAGVGCSECHRTTGPASSALFLATYARWIAEYAGTRKEPAVKAGSVGPEPCLACHEAIWESITVRGGIRVSHKEFLDAGWACRGCHNSVGHPGKVIEPSVPTMDTCLPCHDDKTASSECALCHPEGVGAPSHQEQVAQIPMSEERAKSTCYGCHELQTCTSCHGVRMPHPPDWASAGIMGNHARAAFANRSLCWRCHYAGTDVSQPNYAFCNTCHGLPASSPHGATERWVREHGPQAVGAKPGYNSDCFYCHGQSLCDNCHPPEYVQRFAPIGGYDTDPGAPPIQPGD